MAKRDPTKFNLSFKDGHTTYLTLTGIRPNIYLNKLFSYSRAEFILVKSYIRLAPTPKDPIWHTELTVLQTIQQGSKLTTEIQGVRNDFGKQGTQRSKEVETEAVYEKHSTEANTGNQEHL